MGFCCGRGRNRGVGTAVICGNPAELVGNAGGAGGVDEASFVRHPENKNNNQGKFTVMSLSALNLVSSQNLQKEPYGL